MSKFDEFDLDIKSVEINDPGVIEPMATTGLLCGIVIGSVLTGCTGDCLTTNCPPHEPSINSPCGSGMRRVI